MKDQWVETLNIMGKGDIYQDNYNDIVDLCIKCSRGSSRLKPARREVNTRDSKDLGESITRSEIRILLEDFKTDILGTLTTQIDVMQAKQKQAIIEQNLAIFCLHCRKKHSHKECPLDAKRTCTICTQEHTTESCPSLPGLKAIFKEVEEEAEPVYQLNQHRQWQAR